MPSAFIFYTLLFLALLVVSAGLILVALLFLDHERQLWQRMATDGTGGRPNWLDGVTKLYGYCYRKSLPARSGILGSSSRST